MIKITDYADTQAQELLEFCASALNISSGEIVISVNTKIVSKFDTKDLQVNAILHESAIKHLYNLLLRKKGYCIEEIICHEMVHLKQYESNELSLDFENRIFTWKGKTYDSSVAYDERPWEIEAFKMQYKLLREWRKHKKELKKQEKLQKKSKKFGK